MSFDPKKVLVAGFAVILNIKGKTFAGVITGDDKEADFMVRLARPDQTVLAMMLDSNCGVQCITDDGLAYKFECQLKSKRVPNVGLAYPAGELNGISVRKIPRTPVSYWTAVLGVQNEGGKPVLKPVGEGNLVDITEGGCKLMTNVQYKVNDPIYLEFEYGEGKPPLRFKGKIRQVRSAPYGSTYYGIQFENPSPNFLTVVKSIMENPEL